MVYTLDNSQAKYASDQRGLKRRINLPLRLSIKHAIETARAPGRWLARTAAQAKHRSEFETFKNRQFKIDGCLSVTDKLQSECMAAVATWQPRCDELLGRLGAETPRTPWKVEELLDDESIRALIFNRFVVGTLAAYLGEAPIFSGVTLWIGQKEKKFAGSPFYHTDSCGWGNAKFYVYLSDVGKGFGEFTYVPRYQSEAFIRNTGYLGDAIPDTDVNSYFKRDPSIGLIGKAGSGFLIDTTKCLHFGSRCTEGNRYSLIISYQRWSAPNSEVGRGPGYLKKIGYDPRDAMARLLIDP